MDDFAFPDEENLLKMQKEYEKVLGGKTLFRRFRCRKTAAVGTTIF